MCLAIVTICYYSRSTVQSWWKGKNHCKNHGQTPLDEIGLKLQLIVPSKISCGDAIDAWSFKLHVRPKKKHEVRTSEFSPGDLPLVMWISTLPQNHMEPDGTKKSSRFSGFSEIFAHFPSSYPLVNIQKAMENGPVEIVDLPIENGGFPSFFGTVYQRVYSIKWIKIPLNAMNSHSTWQFSWVNHIVNPLFQSQSLLPRYPGKRSLPGSFHCRDRMGLHQPSRMAARMMKNNTTAPGGDWNHGILWLSIYIYIIYIGNNISSQLTFTPFFRGVETQPPEKKKQRLSWEFVGNSWGIWPLWPPHLAHGVQLAWHMLTFWKMLHVWNIQLQIDPKNDPNVGTYSIHWASGILKEVDFLENLWANNICCVTLTHLGKAWIHQQQFSIQKMGDQNNKDNHIYTWKTIKTKFSVRTGLDIFFVRYVFFPNTAMSGCKPSTYRLI